MKTAAVIALVGIVAACGHDESRIQFGVYEDVQILRPLLGITAKSGDWSTTVTGEDIGTAHSPNHSREFETPRSGTLLVEVVLRQPGEPVLAEGAVELEIRENWVWGVDIFLTGENPADLCFGCMGHKAFPVPAGLTSEPGDSLFIVWGGNSISDPVVY